MKYKIQRDDILRGCLHEKLDKPLEQYATTHMAIVELYRRLREQLWDRLGNRVWSRLKGEV